MTFAERETEKRISIEVVDDAVSEQEESFVLFIANEGGCNTLLVSIVDNDGECECVCVCVCDSF